jgi:hypothetical protein
MAVEKKRGKRAREGRDSLGEDEAERGCCGGLILARKRCGGVNRSGVEIDGRGRRQRAVCLLEEEDKHTFCKNPPNFLSICNRNKISRKKLENIKEILQIGPGYLGLLKYKIICPLL